VKDETMTSVTPTNAIPKNVLDAVRRAAYRTLKARQLMREARHYATIESGTGAGSVDRTSYVERRRDAGVSASAIRQDRATIRKVATIAQQKGIDWKPVVDAIWTEEAAGLPKLRFELTRVAGVRSGSIHRSIALLEVNAMENHGNHGKRG